MVHHNHGYWSFTIVTHLDERRGNLMNFLASKHTVPATVVYKYFSPSWF